uniref:Ppx/GppA phosphatase family protein n=1 Tax=Ningiella ruwaisensis TaxID=2364274 RepID=UPI001F4F7754|nr:exopolyphosphatase [Ningiella ruwaisensis]
MQGQNLYQIFDNTEQRNTEVIAALDIGSNSFHLVVARVVADAVQVINRIKHKVRLAEGLDEKNVLSEEAMERGLTALESMAESIQGVSADSVRIVATHTLRRAKNAQTFIRRARKIFPYPIEVISGAEEARLIYVGIANYSNIEGSRLIIDIGGGSTEFAVGKSSSPQLCKSVQMGCVSYQKRFFPDGVINRNAVESAITAAQQDLELACANLREFHWQHSIASSGTAKALALVAHPNEEGIAKPFNQHDLQLLVARCIEKGRDENLDFDGLTEDRKPVFVPGLCIMLAICQSLNLKQIEISNEALREGVLSELQGKQTSQNVRVRTAQSLATRYDVDTQYAHKVLKSCMQIYNQVKADWQLEDAKYRFMLGWSALLHEIGLQVNSRGIQKHSAYILSNSDLPGFNQDQQKVMSTLVRFHRKKIQKDMFPISLEYSEECISRMLAILRLGILLNINRQLSNEIQVECKVRDAALYIRFADGFLSNNALLQADLDKERRYLKASGVQLEVE